MCFDNSKSAFSDLTIKVVLMEYWTGTEGKGRTTRASLRHMRALQLHRCLNSFFEILGATVEEPLTRIALMLTLPSHLHRSLPKYLRLVGRFFSSLLILLAGGARSTCPIHRSLRGFSFENRALRRILRDMRMRSKEEIRRLTEQLLITSAVKTAVEDKCRAGALDAEGFIRF